MRLKVPRDWWLTLVLGAVALCLLAMLVFDLAQQYL
jgi:hypothetical protein